MDSDRLLSRPFVLCFLSNLFQALSFNLFLHLPGFLMDLGAGEVQIGFLGGLTAMAAIAVRPTLGRVMDARGRRDVIVWGNVLKSATLGLYLTVTSNGPWIYLIRVLHGVAQAMLFTALFTYAADCVPERRRTEGLMMFGVSGMMPIALSGILGDWILAHWGFDEVFLAALALGAVALVLSLPLVEMARFAVGPDEEGTRGFRAVLRQRDLIPLWTIATVFALALAAMFIFVKPFVERVGIGSVGGFFSAYAGVALLFRVFLGWIPDRVGAKRVLFPALAIQALGFLLLAYATDDRQVFLAGAFCGAGHGYIFPLLFGMVVSRARDADRGSAMAIYTALFDLGVLLGGPLLGGVIDVFGYTRMYQTAAGLIVVGSLAFAVADRGRS